MILELDCGNSLLKWRVVSSAGVCIAGVAEDIAGVLVGLGERAVRVDAARLVSVRSNEETELLVSQLTQELSVPVAQASWSCELAGVLNGYEDQARLGLDRWLALVAGYQLAPQGCLVLDLGTAITADFVAAQGLHLGGFIAPGITLMRAQLQAHTRRIRYQLHEGQEADVRLPGRNTANAVERGCVWMIKGFVAEQVNLARELLGEKAAVFITGGDAALVAEVCPSALVVNDLVFRGLALACPIQGV